MTKQIIAMLPRVASLALSLVAASTATSAKGEASSSLAGSTWRLAELRSSDDAIAIVRPDDSAKYEMTLGTDGAAALRLDCNRAAGRWTSSTTNQTTGTMTFTPLAMTRAACPPGSLDTRVARELGFVRTYIVEGDSLHLIMMADGGSQVWSRVRE